MSFIFIPDSIDFSKGTTSITFEDEDVFLTTSMDKGQHSRMKGSATVQYLKITKEVRREQVAIWRAFKDLVGVETFYGKFPDPTDPSVDHSKYYAFRFAKANVQRKRKGKTLDVYNIDFEFYWDFRIEGIDRV